MLEGESTHPSLSLFLSLLPTQRYSCTYRRRDSPTPHARHLEAPFLHLFIGQLHMEIELIVSSAYDDLAAFLGEVSDARVELDVAVVF